MRITQESREVQVAGAKKSGTYTMVMNGKSFMMMTSTLYKNKIGSIVREIGCNALDGHRGANKSDVPFSIHLPTATEPWFTVQDFGTGMSPEIFDDVYKVFFESTKDQGNDDVGAYGLGAKTPYSYGEKSFVVINRYNGVEYQYSAYVDEENMPQIPLMHELLTDESNGVTVKIPVERDDFHSFKSEVLKQYKFFPIKPTIENNDIDFEWDVLEEPTLTIGDVEIMNIASNDGYDRPIDIVQGPVGYPLVISEIKDKLAPENVETLNMLKRVGARINFKIGDIGVTISREDIDYIKPTIDNINKKLSMFRLNLADYLKQKMDTFDNDWSRAVELNANTTLRILADAANYKLPNTYQKGDKVLFEASDNFIKVVEDKITRHDGTIIPTKRIDRFYKLVTYIRNPNNGNIIMKISKNPDELEAHGSIKKIYVRDTSSQPISRVKHEMIENELVKIVVLTLGTDHKKTVTTAFDERTINKISKLFGGIKMQSVAELDKPPVPIYNSTDSKPIGYQISANDMKYKDIYSTYNWKRVYGNLNEIEISVYVTTERYDVNNDNDNLGKFEQLCQAGLVDTTLYAFNSTNTKKIENLDGWVKLDDFVKENYAKINPLFDKFEQLAIIENLDYKARSSVSRKTAKHVRKFEDLIDSELGLWYFKIIHKIEKVLKWKKSKLTDKERNFYDTFNDKIKQKFSDSINDNEHVKRFEKAQDLFQFIPQGSTWSPPSDGVIEHIIQYVNCMGKGA